MVNKRFLIPLALILYCFCGCVTNQVSSTNQNNGVLEFELSKEQAAEIQVYNIQGDLILSLGSGVYKAGNHQINLNPYIASRGVYFCKVIAEEYTFTRKVVIVK
ncbi:MAG: T9SS type A sorting domain-containing protein [Chloroherpetonaceae bacterium]|nr:T9SS type A sorting domain-containing protein [Chloroherpetonaceae bacterium]